MKDDLISIIMPIYNVEQYLNKCIETVVNQTYKNIEIILVDDGSLDNCYQICEEWKNKDNRIVVIHKRNGGLSDARNAGIDIAKGNYICFIDSDDYVQIDFVDKLYKEIKCNNTNISQCSINFINDLDEKINTIGYKNKCIKTGRQLVIESLDTHFIENEVIWNRMYKKEIFNKLRFPKGKVHEDEYITYKILYNEKSVAILNEALYNYRQSNNSIMRSNYSIKKYSDFSDAYKEKIEYFKRHNDNVVFDMVIRSYISNLSNIYIKLKNSDNNISKDVFIEIKNQYRKWYKYIIKSRNICLKNKIKVSIFFISPNIYTFLKKYKKRWFYK